MAEKSPSKFYSRVLNQDIKKCTVKMRNKLFFVWTQRPLLKIIDSVKSKLIKRITDIIGGQYEFDVANALGAGGEIETDVMQMVENEEIELMDENKDLLIKQQLSKLSKASAAENDYQGDTGGMEPVDLRVESPDAKKLDKAELQIKDQQFIQIEEKVINYVRRNSKLKAARYLPLPS